MRTLAVLYTGIYLVTAGLAGGLGYWAVTRTAIRSRRWFGLLMTAMFLWTALALVSLIAPAEPIQQLLQAAWGATGLTVVILWLAFTVDYTHRSVRESWVIRAFGAIYAVLGILAATSPWHSLYYGSMVVTSTPLTHVVTTAGPARLPVIVYTLSGIGIGTYYLGNLFKMSHERSRTPTLVLAGGVIVGVVPFIVTQLGLTPIETYDHTIFGVSVFVLAVSYAVFRHSFYDLVPIARDVVLDEIENPLFVLGDDYTLADYNTAASALVPAVDSESIGTRIDEVVPGLEASVVDSAADDDTEVRLPVAEGSREFDVVTSELRAGAKKEGYALLMRDITERNRRERRLKKQNERLDQFAEVVSHDLRNPLNVAQAHVELLDGDETHVDTLDDALERMESIIDDMLLLAQVGDSLDETESVNLQKASTRAWDIVQTGGATLDSEVPWALTVDAGSGLLEHVFENLYRNAVEHNDDDVTVRVGVLEEDAGFYVGDDGNGISEAERESIFEHGYTTDSDGTGLGLAIVSDIVEAHGWQICVTDSNTGGARFEIRDANVHR